MPVKLTVNRYRDQTPATPLTCLIDPGGTLGRAPGNDLVLDDPGKYISRSHARIERRPEGYCLIDIGSNPSVINERLLGHGREALLSDGDQLVIGDYQIGVNILEQALACPAAPDAGDTQTQAVFIAPVVPTPDSPASPEIPEPPRIEPGTNGPLPAVDPLAEVNLLHGEADYDPLPGSDDPLGLNWLEGGAQEPRRTELDPMPGVPVFLGPQSDHVAPQLHAFPVAAHPTMPGAAASVIPEGYDPLADVLAPIPDAAYVEPMPVCAANAPPTEPASPAAQYNDPVAGADPVLTALLEGLGLPELRTSRSPEALARMVGKMLRQATAGTMDVLLGRALTKRESHIEMTMIGSRSNNPLKFFPDPASALSQMLSTDAPAYLPGVQALDAAFDDLRAHELAVIAAMREAVREVVARFDPVSIERHFTSRRVLDRLMPSTRKARLWARHTELYGELVRDGDENLQRLFADRFSVTYQQQVSRLREVP